MEARIIEALVELGYNIDWILNGKGDKRTNNQTNNQNNNVNINNGTVGINGNNSTIVNKIKSKLNECKSECEEGIDAKIAKCKSECEEGIDVKIAKCKSECEEGIDAKIAKCKSECETKITTTLGGRIDESIGRIDSLQKSLKNFRLFTFVFIGILLIASSFAICTSLKAFSLDSMAYLGLIIATLSMLVIVLMSWQIFNIIDLRELKSEIKEFTKLEGQVQDIKRDITKLERQINNSIDELNDKYINLCIESKETRGIAYSDTKVDQSIYNYLLAIKLATKSKNKLPIILIVAKMWSLAERRNTEVKNAIKKHSNIVDEIRQLRGDTTDDIDIYFDDFITVNMKNEQ
jgi:hypothetical protein